MEHQQNRENTKNFKYSADVQYPGCFEADFKDKTDLRKDLRIESIHVLSKYLFKRPLELLKGIDIKICFLYLVGADVATQGISNTLNIHTKSRDWLKSKKDDAKELITVFNFIMRAIKMSLSHFH